MIYDCFTFFNELDLLEIRLNVLDDVVDKFVLVEMSKTHTGDEKEFIFENNKQRFSKFLNKIIHIKVNDFPRLEDSQKDPFGNKWLLENYQRDSIMRGLTEAKDNDIVIVSDLDEIPNPKVVKQYDGTGIWVLEQMMCYYYINNLCYTDPVWKNGVRIATFKNMKDPLQEVHKSKKEFCRFSAYGLPTYFRFCQGKFIKNGGWHFSYCGGVNAIIKKRQAIVEQQFNNEKNMSPDYIAKKIKTGQDILDRKKYKYKAIPLDGCFPEYIVKNKSKYKQLVLDVPFFSKILFYVNKSIKSIFHKI